MFDIDDIKILYSRAEGNNIYYDEINDEKRKVEAFFIQAALLEGVLCEIAFREIKCKYPRIAKKRNNRYGLNSAIDDLYLLKIITDSEFEQLEKFKSSRNKYFHSLLRCSPEELEDELGDKYNEFERITWSMIKKLESLSKT